MSYDYSGFEALAKRMIDKFGRDIEVNTISSIGDNWNPTQTTTPTTIKAVMTKHHQIEKDGTLVEGNNYDFLSYEEITNKNTLTDLGKTFSVINVEIIQPGSSKIIYKALVKI